MRMHYLSRLHQRANLTLTALPSPAPGGPDRAAGWRPQMRSGRKFCVTSSRRVHALDFVHDEVHQRAGGVAAGEAKGPAVAGTLALDVHAIDGPRVAAGSVRAAATG